jgi:hypothetical protein
MTRRIILTKISFTHFCIFYFIIQNVLGPPPPAKRQRTEHENNVENDNTVEGSQPVVRI